MRLNSYQKIFLLFIILSLYWINNGKAQDTTILNGSVYDTTGVVPKHAVYKTIELGFHISPIYNPRNPEKTKTLILRSQSALQSLVCDKIQVDHLRIGWPFLKGFSSSEFIEILKRFIYIDRNGDGVGDYHILLSLSDYEIPENEFPCPPYEFAPNYGVLDWSNRWAPRRIGRTIEDYVSNLTLFIEELENAGLLNSLTFELGNEPEAKRYFWGTTNEYKEIVIRYKELLSQWNCDLVCCGFTATLLGGNDLQVKTMDAGRCERDQHDKCQPTPTHDVGETIDKKPYEYINFIKNNQFFTDPYHHVTPSFHYYTNNINDPTDLNLPEKSVRGSYITEYNMLANLSGDGKKHDMVNSGLFISAFAEFLYFTYMYNIPRIYFHKLTDSGDNPFELGLFDTTAAPKVSYKCFKLIMDHLGIQNGYFVEERIDKEGPGKYIILKGGIPSPPPGVIISKELSKEISISRLGPVLMVAVEGKVQFPKEYKNNILHYFNRLDPSTPPDPLKAWRYDNQDYPGDWIIYTPLIPKHPMTEGCNCPH